MPERNPELHHGHRERVKARFLQDGLSSFADYEVLELMLFYSVPQKDVNELAHQLINTFGSLKGVLEASYEDLLRVKGIGANSASMICLARGVALRYLSSETNQRIPMISHQAMMRRLAPHFYGEKNEKLVIMSLDPDYYYINETVIATGDLEYVDFNMRNIIHKALSDNAAFLVLAHNHPGGSPRPSQPDIHNTVELAKALSTVGIRLETHFIYGADENVDLSADPLHAHIFKTNWASMK